MEGREKSLATSHQGPRRTGGGMSFRVTICNSTGRGQDARLMAQEMSSRKGAMSVSLSFLLASSLLLSPGACERQCQRP